MSFLTSPTTSHSPGRLGRSLGFGFGFGFGLGLARKSKSKPGSKATPPPPPPPPPPTGAAQQAIPTAVFAIVAGHLRDLHPCESCYLRNLSFAARTCRSWRDGLAPILYRDIAIATSSSSPSSGSGSPKGKKRSPAPRRSRLHLLHRTLIARPDLAGHIHTLTLPAVGPQSDVARLILLCPNLRRLSGPQSPFTPGRTDRVHAALATRTQLEEQLWYVTDGGGGRGGGGGGGPLQERWTGLRTLVLHGSNPWGQDARVLPAFAETLSALAGLRKLMVSSFGAFAFTDESLAGLPAGLTHLRLARLAGVTDAGVVAACGRTAQLTSLSLEEVGLSRLATVATLLDALPRLRRFALAQAVLPTTTTTTTPTTTTPVLLASDSLEHVLWSVPTLHQNHVSATAALSASIRAGRLPALRSLAAPADDGTLRAACAAAPAPLGRGLTCDWLGWRGSAALWRPSAHASDCGGGDGTNVAFVAERRTPDVDGIVVRAGADESSEPCCRGHRSASARAEVRLDALFG